MLVCSVGYSQLTGEDGNPIGGGGGTSSQGNFLPEVVPPSPEAAALSRFTEVPVSHYSGLANVSIPIHTIATKGIQIPISLSYHGRGVKVSEIAPRTGMGWSLTYGGDISRQIRGKADDGAAQNTYFLNANDFMNYSVNQDIRDAVSTRQQSDPSFDFYPDQFTFSGGGTSGKFVFDYTNLEPVIQSFGDVKITYDRENGNSGRIIAFQVTDTSGNVFYYGKSKDGLREARDLQVSSIGFSIYSNGNQVLDGPGSGEQNFSSWKLMDIETVYGELISYHYIDESLTRYEKAYDKHDPTPGGRPNSPGNMSDITKISSKINEIDEQQWQLSEITYNQGRVEFTKELNLRADFDGYALDKITIYDQNNKKVKAFDLNYTYTTSTDNTNVLSYITQMPMFTKSLKRMFLTSIEEEGNNGVKLPPYEFTYNTTVLPSRFSTSQDYWGYYNGATDNGPFLRLFEYGFYKPDRRVHLENSKAGLLEEIKYPTGGITKLTYEHNKGLIPWYFSEVRTPAINPASEAEVRIELDKNDFYDATTGTYKTLNFEIPPLTVVKYTVTCSQIKFNNQEHYPDCAFEILKDGWPVSSDDYGIEQETSLCIENSISFGVNIPNYGNGVPTDLHLSNESNFTITIVYDQPLTNNILYAAGKRIKKIEYVTETDTRVKEFEYPYGGEGFPSGSIIGLPGFINIDQNNPGPCSNNLTSYFDQTSTSSAFQANSIGYSFVTEYNGTKDNNEGKIEYTFTNMIDGGGKYYEFPYHPSTDNEWLRGKNVSTKIYSNEPTKGYIIEKEIHNKYLYGNNLYNEEFIQGGLPYENFDLSPEYFLVDWNQNFAHDYIGNDRTLFRLPLFRKSSDGDVFDNSTWKYRIFYLAGGTVNLHSTTERNYFNGKVLESETKYFYDYPNHYQLKSTEMTDSKGDIYKTENGFNSSLIAQNRMQPVTTTSYKNTSKLGVQHTVYKTEHGILLPEKIQTSKGTNTLEDRATFHSYDSSGNPVEVSKKDGSKIYYVWGYDKTQPIAKIEGYTSISSAQLDAINDAINSSNNDIDASSEEALRASLTTLRNTAFPDAQVTTFTYDPLVGVTSITDPRGEVVYYEYDEFKRLRFVKNTQGQILKEHSYNYKN